MKKMLMIPLVAMALASPAFAANNSDIDNQKAQVQHKYDQDKSQENQSYDQAVSDAKSKYSGDQLSSELSKLKIEHQKKLDDLKANEKLDQQNLDEKKNS